LRVDSSGNVVIGTSSALSAYKTSIQHTSGELLALRASSGTLTRIAFGNADASLGNTQIIANSTALAFVTGATEKMRITSAGNVGIGTTAPATKLDVVGSIRSSVGILFGTDTAAANTLDDYEEGTWTPTLVGATTAGDYTVNVTEAVYVAIGSLVYVFVTGSITINSAGTGRMRFGGLPFNYINESANFAFRPITNFTIPSNNTGIIPFANFTNANSIDLGYYTTSNQPLNVDSFTTGAIFRLAGVYRKA
jgi:hypothetical protein